MRILVTGCEGLLGKAINRLADGAKNEYIFTGYDDFDITDSEAVELMIKVNAFDVVVNCAAITDCVKAGKFPEIAETVNVTGVKNLIDATKRYGGLLIQPVCQVGELPDNSMLSRTKRQCGEMMAQSCVNGIVLSHPVITLEQWEKDIDRVARYIVDFIDSCNNHFGLEIIEYL